MDKGRRARAIVTYDGRDISEAIAASLISISVTCNADDSADDCTIEIHDRDLMWIGPWYPKVRSKSKDAGSGSG